MFLNSASKLMLIRICTGKSVLVTSLSPSVEELFKKELAYLECPNYLKPTEKGEKLVREIKSAAQRS